MFSCIFKGFAAVCILFAPAVVQSRLAKCPRIAVSCDISCPSAATCDFHPATMNRCAFVTCIKESDGRRGDIRNVDRSVSFASKSTSDQQQTEPLPRHEIHLKKRSTTCPDLASRCHCAEGEKCVQVRGNTQFSCGQVRCE